MIENFEDFYQTNKASCDAKIANLKKGTSYTVVAMPIDADGKCGSVVNKTITTKDYPYDDTNLKVAVKSVTVSETNPKEVTVVFEITGATKLAMNGSYYGNEAQFVSSTSGQSAIEKSVATAATNSVFRPEDTDGDGLITVVFGNYNPAKYYDYKYVYV